jgi:hypothetical protein
MKHLKEACAGCDEFRPDTNKEHVFPKWLIRRAKVTQIKWRGRWVSPMKATIPLCENCNSTFGSELELPCSRIFADLEAGRGISEFEADILARWMWKGLGLDWMARNPGIPYTPRYSLRERVLRPIDDMRSEITIAISLAEKVNLQYGGEAATGFDSTNEVDAVFASGVFCRLALIASYRMFEGLIPDRFSKFQFSPRPNELSMAKVWFPKTKTGFRDDDEAVGITKQASDLLSAQRDNFALTLQRDPEIRQRGLRFTGRHGLDKS